MTFKERYQYNPTTDLLGKGGFARVFKANDILLEREVAIKVFNASDKGQYTVIEEIKKAIRLEHPNLLRYYDVAIVENTNALGEKDIIQIGVMELANAGDLKQFVNSFPNSPILPVLLRQVLSGLEYLHQKGIVHRDLKPQNILLTNYDGVLTAKISDFGISKNLDSGTSSSSMAIGTIEYMAPEQFNPAKYGINGKIHTNVDLWSFGIMVYELITNQPLFGQRGGHTTAEQIMNAILSPEKPAGINLLPEPYKSIVAKCLVSDANMRVQYAKDLIPFFNKKNHNSNASAETLIFEMPKGSPAEQLDETSGTLVLPKVENIPSKVKDEAVAMPVNIQTTTKSQKAKSYLIILIAFLGLGSIAFFMLKNIKSNHSSTFNIIDSSKNLLEQRKFKEAIVLLNDSVIAPGAETRKESYRRALPIYANALLGIGDTLKSIPFLERAASFNDIESIYQIGFIYFTGKFKTKDLERARQFFIQAAKAKDPRAEVMLGNMYFMGQGVSVDFNTAIDYYFAAADQGNCIAMYALGIAYLNGAGVPQDTKEAKKWFEKVVTTNTDASAVLAAKEQLKNLP